MTTIAKQKLTPAQQRLADLQKKIKQKSVKVKRGDRKARAVLQAEKHAQHLRVDD